MYKKTIFMLASLLIVASTMTFSLDADAKHELQRCTFRLLERNQKWIGTAFAVSADGLLVSNHHVVDGYGPKLHLETYDGKIQKVTVLDTDPIADLALMRLDSGEFKDYIELRRGSGLRPGESVATYGFPDDGTEGERQGRVDSVRGYWGPDCRTVPFVVTRMTLTEGMSGSALVDEDGRLVGVNKGKDGVRLTYSIPLSYLKTMLARV